MSIGPLGHIAAAAGSPLAQQKGTDAQRVAQDQAAQSRETASSRQAAKAEGIGETEQDHQATDRDADGRRAWERTDESPPSAEQPVDESPPPADGLSRDATGDRGTQLDISG